MASEKPVLYTYFRSSCSWRLRIALALKNIDHEQKYIHLLTEQQFDEQFKKVNPMGQVPAFIMDGKTMTQTVAILEYLEEKYPEPALLPSDPWKRFKVRELVEIVNSGIQPIANLAVMLKHSDDPAERSRWVTYFIEKGFTALEALLKECSGKYCLGDELTLADIFLVPQVGNAHRFKVDMTPFPLISAINDRLSELEAFKVAHFSKQADCPEELRT